MMNRWPVVVASHDVVKPGVDLVAFLLECTHCACVAVAGGMVTMGPTVAAHASQLFPRFLYATATAANIAATIVPFVGKCFCELGNGIAQHLQLRCHFVGFLLRTVANVGCNLVLLFVLGNRCCCNCGSLVPEFIAFVDLVA
jgi:hypothetical protein